MKNLATAALDEARFISGEAGAKAARFLEGGGAAALAGFGADGAPIGGADLPAGAFVDHYKYSMLPVIRQVEAERGGDVHVVLALNVRTPAARDALAESARRRSALYLELLAAIQSLTRRRWVRADFERACDGLPSVDPAAVTAVCGPPGAPRALVDAVKIGEERDAAQRDPAARGKVIVRVYLRAAGQAEAALLRVEAEGPWHRVSWVETPLMQAVHETMLRHRLGCALGREREGEGGQKSQGAVVPAPPPPPRTATPYARWLARALCRCARSVDAANASGLRIYLFSGRRCGGFAWLLLQNAYCAAALERPLGTASVMASETLRAHGLPAMRPAGTHAHELSMVLGVCYPELDELARGTVATQCLGHALYLALSWPGGDASRPHRSALMPMLSDTLGSRAFLRAAATVLVPPIEPFHESHRGRRLLDAIGGARHDSGSMAAFAALLRGACGEEQLRAMTIMTSEIGTAADLAEARKHGFTAVAAGGFFGDSEKAWADAPPGVSPASVRAAGREQAEDPGLTALTDVSMAVKPIAVYVRGARTRFHPVKLGDPSPDAAAAGAVAGGPKVEIDAMLTAEARAACRARAEWLAECAVRPAPTDAEASELNYAFAALTERILRAARCPPDLA